MKISNDSDKGDHNQKPHADKKIVLLAGATGVIGRHLAHFFGIEQKDDYHVVLMSRNIEELETLYDQIIHAHGSATILPIDITAEDRLDQLSLVLYKHFGRLDIYCSCTGFVHALAPLAHIAPDQFYQTIMVNFTSQWRILRAIDSLLNASDRPTALFMTDQFKFNDSQNAPKTNDNHTPSPCYWGAYAASKAALNTMIESYAAEKQSFGKWHVHLLDPGDVFSPLYERAYPGRKLTPSENGKALDRIKNAVNHLLHTAPSTKDGAQTDEEKPASDDACAILL